MSQSARSLPAVEQVLELESTAVLLRTYRRGYVVGLVRRVLQELRGELLESGGPADREVLLARAGAALEAAAARGERPSLRRAINATGIVLHTGLGRASLPAAALAAIQQAAAHYCNLELDLEEGQRGSRLDHVEGLICELADAEAAGVVNNNAAAVLLMLNTLAQGREVVVSRGELVEIGGSFRIPDIVGASGARIREVGTTNRTHLRDYEQAVGQDTALILVVHPSNYRVEGFTARPALRDLVALGRRAGVPVVYDLGGGVLVDLEQWGLPHEPVVGQALAQGVDLVSFSGDKVLGGPQAGIIAGSRCYVELIRKNPMMRALRCDKLVLAGLEASLRLFRLAPEVLREVHPVLRMLTEPVERVEERAQALLAALPAQAQERLRPVVEETVAQAGSGALPLEELPSRAVALRPDCCSAAELARRLRLDERAVVGRVHRQRVLLDLRTVRDDEVGDLAAALARAAAYGP